MDRACGHATEPLVGRDRKVDLDFAVFGEVALGDLGVGDFDYAVAVLEAVLGHQVEEQTLGELGAAVVGFADDGEHRMLQLVVV
jgi:hypothetical protein